MKQYAKTLISMKILAFVLLSSFINLVGYSQIQVKETRQKTIIGEVKAGGTFVAELSHSTLSTGDTMYILLYKNKEYQRITDIRSISFTNDGNSLDDLYNIIKSFLTDKEKQAKNYNTDVEVGSRQVNLSYNRGSVLIIAKDGYFTLNEKQLNKLFAKD